MGIEEKLMHIQTQIKAPKNLYNSFGKYKYRNAEGICEAVKPFLDKEKVNLRLSDEIVSIGDRVYVKATATLCDVENNSTVFVSAMARESAEKKGMDESQITGTASSYARKYALNGLFLLDDTKDADTDEYHKQTDKEKSQKQASDTYMQNVEPQNYPEPASVEQIQKAQEFIDAYADMCENATSIYIWDQLKKKYHFNGTGEITAELAEKIIAQVETWYAKKKEVDK